VEETGRMRPFGRVLIDGGRILFSRIGIVLVLMLILALPVIFVSVLASSSNHGQMISVGIFFFFKVFWLISIILVGHDALERNRETVISYARASVHGYRRTVPAFMAIFGANLVYVISQLVTGSFAPNNVGLLIVPFTILIVVFYLRIISAFTLHFAYLQNHTLATAWRKSRLLAKHSWSSLLILFLLTSVLSILSALPFQYRFDLLGEPGFGAGILPGIISGGISTLVEAYLWITITILFHDLTRNDDLTRSDD
jgi:hypothetical protein